MAVGQDGCSTGGCRTGEGCKMWGCRTGSHPCFASRAPRSRNPPGAPAARALARRWSCSITRRGGSAILSCPCPCPCPQLGPSSAQSPGGFQPQSHTRLLCFSSFRLMRCQSAAAGFLLSVVSLTHRYCFSATLAVKRVIFFLYANTNSCVINLVPC